jgi:ferric-dicitrate binding protein FerR (iron transport regulator)
MTGIMTTMAQQAARSEKLLAFHISAYAARFEIDWVDVARQLAITPGQLDKLALCRAPRRDCYAEDLDRIAGYVEMEPATLAWFLEGAVNPSRSESHVAPQNGHSARPAAPARRAPVFSLRRLAVAVAFLALAAFLGAFVLTGTRETSAATLVVDRGAATLTSGDRTFVVFTQQNEEQIIAGGTIAVSAGDAIALPEDGAATLRLSDGSTVDLDGGTQIEVSELVTTDDDYRVRLDMLAGRTVSRVQRVLGAGDAFEIGTPSSTASVRGTVFAVEVVDDETTHVTVSEGTVWFEMDGDTVELHEGDEITGQRGQPLLIATPTDEPTAEPTTATSTETQPTVTSTPIPTAIPTDEPEAAAPVSTEATTPPPTVEPAPTTQPAVVPTDPPVDAGQVVDDAGDTVDETLGNVGDTVDETLGDVGDTVDETLGDVGDTVDETLGDVGDTVDETLGDVGDAVDGLTDLPAPPAEPPANPPVDPPGDPPVDLSDGDGAPPGQEDGGGASNNNGSSDDNSSSDNSSSNNGGGNSDKNK